MKKRMLATLMLVPFILTACGTKETPKETEKPSEPAVSEVKETEKTTESSEVTETPALEMSEDLIGTWTTGENEDTRYIRIYEDATWEVLNVEEIEGWEAIGGEVKTTEDAFELYNGGELYDTVFFGAEEDTLYSANDYTYARTTIGVPESYVGVWETGANEDLSYLIILADGTWKLVPADAQEGEDEFGGTVEVAEDAVELYNEGELYTAVFFGAEENTLYCTFENTFVLVSRDYNEIGD